jgi:predicted RNase H-like HicB family nuclease
MKTYDVIVRLVNNVYVAVVPALPGIRAEGSTRDDALSRARQSIEDFFKSAEVVSVSVDVPAVEFRPYETENDQLRRQALLTFPDDKDAMESDYHMGMHDARRREIEELTLQDEWQTAQAAQQQRRLENLKRRQSALREIRNLLNGHRGEKE